ncbi:MAG: energy transducer TonB [Cyclobacteriaceae bacterium]|nr:energy transducer TonB [Cyclobacteriaceae bacterium]
MKRLVGILTLVLIGAIYSNAQTNGQTQNESSSGNQEEIWYEVDVIAQFPGGYPKFYQYIAKNLKYPADARRDGIEGKVMVQFVIDSTGSIKPETIKVIKGLTKSCDEETIRLISECPKWIPGRITSLNKNVPTRMTVPVTFKR